MNRQSENWERAEFVGFVDESGQMSSHAGEVHSLGALFLPASRSNALETVARQIIEEAYRARPGVHRVKGSMLTRRELYRFADAVSDVGPAQYRFRVSRDASSAGQLALAVESIGAGLAQLRDELTGDDLLDLRPMCVLRQWQREGAILPTYLETMYWAFRNLADTFYSNGVIPSLTLWFDRKLAKESAEMANVLLRLVFFTQFGSQMRFTIPDLFGLTRRRDFRCRISTDKVKPELFLADVFAVCVGRLDRGEDADGTCEEVLARLRRHQNPILAPYPRKFPFSES